MRWLMVRELFVRAKTSSVLPAAIERDTLIAYTTTPRTGSASATTSSATRFTLRNIDPKWDPASFDIDLTGDGSELEMPSQHHWSSYFIAGAKGMLKHLSSEPFDGTPPAEVSLLVTGSVPQGSGLSSSSAMTTAAAITILELCGKRQRVIRRDVTEVAIVSERLVGVNSGGMDQSASVFSQPQNLLHIHFNPLDARPIPTPPALSFVIANTLVQSDKQFSAASCYNLRVAETKLASLLLGGQEPLSTLLPTKGHTSSSKEMQDALTELLKRVEAGELGDEEGLTWEEASEKLGRKGEAKEVEREVSGSLEVKPDGGRLKLKKRARHVFTEARWVYQYTDLLTASPSPDNLLQQLGQLMNDSMASCANDCESSCPELDEMTALALKSGAFGSRVTGAGWGGSTVSLVREDDIPNFIKALREGYYAKRFPNLSQEELDDACFATKPEAGACVVSL